MAVSKHSLRYLFPFTASRTMHCVFLIRKNYNLLINTEIFKPIKALGKEKLQTPLKIFNDTGNHEISKEV